MLLRVGFWVIFRHDWNIFYQSSEFIGDADMALREINKDKFRKKYTEKLQIVLNLFTVLL